MQSTAFMLMAITMISKVSGLVREMVFSNFLGTSPMKDVYVTSNSITVILFGFIFTAISAGFIPMYNRIEAEEGLKKADRFTANLSNILMIVATVLILFAIFFMEPIVRVMAMGYTGEKFDMAVQFSRITIFIVYFAAFNTSFISYLNIKGDFVTPAVTGIIMNASLIFFTWLSAKMNSMNVLAIGVVVSNAIKYIMFPRSVRATGYRHQKLIDFKDKHIKQLMAMSVPIMLSVIAMDVSTILDKTIASSVVEHGGVSALDYGIRLFTLVHGIIIVSITTAAFPKMSLLGQSGKTEELKKMTISSITSGLVIIVPAIVGLIVFAHPIVKLVFERGEFTAQSTAMTAGVLAWYAPSLFGEIIKQLATRTFYSIGDTKTPVYVTVAQVVVDVVLNITLSQIMGLNGLAASTSIGVLFSATMLMILLRRKVGRLHLKQLFVSTGKIVAVAALMGALGWGIYSVLANIHWAIGFILAMILCIAFYGIVILFMQIPEVKQMVNAGYHKLMKRKKRRA